MRRDEVALHLLSASQTSRLSGSGGIRVFVRDVDAVYAELAVRGAMIVKPPQNYDYGMRDSAAGQDRQEARFHPAI